MGAQTLEWRAGDEDFTGTDSFGRTSTIMAGDGAPGLKPSDMLPMSLAACTAYTLVSILRKIEVHFVAHGDVDAVKAQSALDRSHERWCSVSATLTDVVELTFTITVEPA